MPAARAGHSRFVRIGLLVTARAVQARNALTFWPPDDVSKVAVAVIALLRIVRRGVTVETWGSSQHGIVMLPFAQPHSPRCLSNDRVAMQ